MTEIEGIKEAAKILKPHLKEIDEFFDDEDGKFRTLMSQNYHDLGKILKCHLIIESYINRFLLNHFMTSDLDSIRLSFYQKTILLPSSSSPVALIKPGILKVNKIRNLYSHNLQVKINKKLIQPIIEVVNIFRAHEKYNNMIEFISAFTAIACTFLIIAPPKIQKVFTKAFSKIKTNLPMTNDSV